jgi:hypothetical protein
MAKINFDYKQFLLQKGERVGLYGAAGLAVLFIVLGVIMLVGSKGSLSAGANANTLKDEAKKKDNLMQTNKPSEQKLKELTEIDPKLQRKEINTRLDPSLAALSTELFTPLEGLNEHRREPRIFGPTEFLAKSFGIQADFYMFSPDHDGIYVLVNPPPEKKDQKNRGRGAGQYYQAMMAKGAGRPGGGAGGAGGGMQDYMKQMGSNLPSMGSAKGGMAMGMKGAGNPFAPPPGGHDKKVLSLVKFDDLQKAGAQTFAENMVPMRVGMVVGAFPLKQQLEEFQKALRAKTTGELFGGKPEFRFLGINVQRRTITADPKSPAAEWAELPIEKAARWWAVNNGRRPEAENPDLQRVLLWSDHLVMPRPIQFPESPPYPALEMELTSIKSSVDELNKSDAPKVAPTNPFKNEDHLDPYSLNQMADDKESDTDKGTNPPKTGPDGVGAGLEGSDNKDGSRTNPFAGQQLRAPSSALIRFLDFYVEPGKTYEYRVQVRMANPNYNRKDVREDLAEKPELVSEWVEVPQKLTIPEEIRYYAYDIKFAEPKNSEYRGQNAPDKNQAALQIHKWLSVLSPKKDSPSYPVGDWSICERELVYRGERIGQVHQVKVPIWMFDQAQFVLMTNPAERLLRNKHKIDVSFSPAGNNDAVLVDFTEPVVTYQRAAEAKEDGDAPASPKAEDKVPQEVLILSPEGRLLVHNSAVDKSDETPEGKERKARVEAWHKKIQEMEKKNDPKSGKPGDEIFTKPGGPGGQ